MLLNVLKFFKKKFEIIYIHHNDDILPSIPIIFRSKNVLICIHDIIPFKVRERSPLYILYFKISINIAKALACKRDVKIIVPSHSTKRDLIKIGFPPKNVFVIPWGVDFKRYKPMREKNLEEIRIGFLGAWTGRRCRKRIDILLECFLEVKRKYKNVRLILAGKYPEQLINDYKSEVKFLNVLPEDYVPEFYNNIDIFIYPSEYEGFGMQIIEAMACKTLVLGSDIDAFKEKLHKNLLFKLNKESLIEKLEDFLDKKIIKKFSHLLFKSSRKYSWINVVERFLVLIKTSY